MEQQIHITLQFHLATGNVHLREIGIALNWHAVVSVIHNLYKGGTAMTVAYTSFIQIKKHGGSHRTAVLKDFDYPINFGIHGGIKDFYQQKYGREIKGPEYPATLDYVVAGVAG